MGGWAGGGLSGGRRTLTVQVLALVSQLTGTYVSGLASATCTYATAVQMLGSAALSLQARGIRHLRARQPTILLHPAQPQAPIAFWPSGPCPG
eukprot:4134857-Pyramimonas_sp.AAC.1